MICISNLHETYLQVFICVSLYQVFSIGGYKPRKIQYSAIETMVRKLWKLIFITYNRPTHRKTDNFPVEIYSFLCCQQRPHRSHHNNNTARVQKYLWPTLSHRRSNFKGSVHWKQNSLHLRSSFKFIMYQFSHF